MADSNESKRRHPRCATDHTAWVDGVDESGVRFRLVGRCIDVSRGGLCVSLPRAVAVGSLVRVGVPTKGVRVDCKVRHCTSLGDRFQIGLQFKLTRHEPGETAKPDREHIRFTVTRIAWVEGADSSGRHYRIGGRCLDVSECGICVQVPRALEIGSVVRIGIPSERVKAHAEVRNCTKTNDQFKVGLRFQKS